MILLAISNGVKTAIMIALMIIVFYLFIIRPQNQEQKKEQAFRDGLKSGDKVMTAGGIHVTIVSTNELQAQVEIAPSVRIKVSKASLRPVPEPKKK